MTKTLNNKIISKFLKTKLLGENVEVSSISKFPNNIEKSISFLQISPLENLKFAKKSTVITFQENYKVLKKYNISLVVSNNPKFDIALIYNKFLRKEQVSNIDSSVIIGKNCIISPSVKISRGVTIGDNVKIEKNSFIDENVIIHANTKISEDVKILSGSIIGIDAFSFRYNKNWRPILL